MTEAVQNKVVAITGASSGIGAATARHLAAKGAKVMLGARRVDRLNDQVEAIHTAGGEAQAIALDVTDRSSMQNFVDATVDSFGRLDVLIGNAGLMPLSFMDEGKVDEWERMVDVNIKGVLFGIASALPVFRSQKSGHFVHLTSIADRIITPAAAVYSATKFAVRALSDGLRQEVGPDIRVTIIAPGTTESELTDTISNPVFKQNLMDRSWQDVMPAEVIADAIAYAISRPKGIGVNELVVRPTSLTF